MKAIIPAAGLGTRLLPATKAQPKEMLPVYDKPTIHYVIEEALQSGVDDRTIRTDSQLHILLSFLLQLQLIIFVGRCLDEISIVDAPA